MTLLPLLLIGGTILVLRNTGRTRGPAGSGSSTKDSLPPAAANPCVYGPNVDDLSKAPDNAFFGTMKTALLLESDPDELDKIAEGCEAVCQTTLAKAMRDKAKNLRALGIPGGYKPSGGMPGPSGMPESIPFPIPGVESTPMPSSEVPDAAPGLPNITPEMGSLPKAAPVAGYQSSPTTQWWSGPLKAGESPWSFAQCITGDGRRYVELMAANPEKATVGTPGTAGYTFVSFKIGERIRVPRSWNIYVDMLGKVVCGGKPLPIDPALWV